MGTERAALTGGCLCGAVRYRVEAPVPDVAYCHCRTCRRAAGAPVAVWGSVPIDGFRYDAGTPAVYLSSDVAQREFCSRCGTQLAFRKRDGARFVDFTLASLDTPDAITPTYHIWRMSRIGGFETADALPRHDGRGPDTYF
ncbi:MAG: GFA family protein [Alphaproteobacteria bacterium]